MHPQAVASALFENKVSGGASIDVKLRGKSSNTYRQMLPSDEQTRDGVYGCPNQSLVFRCVRTIRNERRDTILAPDYARR